MATRCPFQPSLGISLLSLCLASGGWSAPPTNLTEISAARLGEMDLQALMQIEVPTVIAASKHEQKVTEAPASVTIVTRDDIQKFGYRTLGDILKSVPGFYITYDRSYGFIGVRGFSRPGDYGGRILMLVNGHRLNDPVYDSAPAATDYLLDVDLIERVEVVRGPGSSLYGNNAFFGVINVITRRGKDIGGTEVAASAGTFDSYQGRATYGQLLSNGVEVVVSASVQDKRGDERLFVRDFDGYAIRRDDDQFRSVFGSASYRDLTLEGGYILRDKQVPNALYQTLFGDPRFQLSDERAFAELRWERSLADGTDILARGYYDYYAFGGDYPYALEDTADPSDARINRDDQRSQSAGIEVRGRRTFRERHTVTAGLEFHSDFELILKNNDLDPAFTYQDTRSDAYWLAAYAQDEWRLLERLVVNGGARYDYYQDFGSTVNPRLALIWSPLTGTTFKAISGTAFRAPNAYERLYLSTVNSAATDLGPEKITSAELIWEQAIGRHLRGSVSAFRNEVDDLINQTRDVVSGNDVYENLYSATSEGAEFALEGQWTAGWRGRLSYTLAETEDDEGRRLDNSPQHLAKLNVIAPLYGEKVFAGLETLYTSDRTAPSGDQLDDFVIVNLTLFARELRHGWDVSASVYNLFDTEYSDPTDDVPALVEQDGREFRLKVARRF